MNVATSPACAGGQSGTGTSPAALTPPHSDQLIESALRAQGATSPGPFLPWQLSLLGNRVLRTEDPKFLTTGGKYVDDLLDEPLLAGAAHVTYVRSTVAHGRILAIDSSAASVRCSNRNNS